MVLKGSVFVASFRKALDPKMIRHLCQLYGHLKREGRIKMLIGKMASVWH
jgi:hypothetical protein